MPGMRSVFFKHEQFVMKALAYDLLSLERLMVTDRNPGYADVFKSLQAKLRTAVEASRKLPTFEMKAGRIPSEVFVGSTYFEKVKPVIEEVCKALEEFAKEYDEHVFTQAQKAMSLSEYVKNASKPRSQLMITLGKFNSLKYQEPGFSIVFSVTGA